MRLAKGITSVFYSEEEAENAEKQFVTTFQQGGNVPDDIPEYTVKDDEKILDIIVGQKWLVPAVSSPDHRSAGCKAGR